MLFFWFIAFFCDGALAAARSDDLRVVFSLTTLEKRIERIKPVLDAIVERQTISADVVYLAVPPSVKTLPTWLQQYDKFTSHPGVLKVLHMDKDYGPASKLLAAVKEGGESSPNTTIIYGDDDIIYGNLIIEQHVLAQSAKLGTAFGSRRISIGENRKKESLLEATGTISIRASDVPHAVFEVQSMPSACFLSDDYWISHHLVAAGLQLELLPHCQYDFSSQRWPTSCGAPFEPVKSIESIGALSLTNIDENGEVTRSGGNWRAQLGRYSDCQKIIFGHDVAGGQTNKRHRSLLRYEKGENSVEKRLQPSS